MAPAWGQAVTDPERTCVRAADAALATLPTPLEGLRGRAEVAITLADDAYLRDLNRTWRGIDKPTNVLSFPNFDRIGEVGAHGPVLLGDVVLAIETVRREADEQDKTVDAHLAHLVVHGVLHLLGHDHGDDAQAERMEGLERRIVAGLGHPDPYADGEAA